MLEELRENSSTEFGRIIDGEDGTILRPGDVGLELRCLYHTANRKTKIENL